MSPREKHIPDDAQRTSVCLTAEDKMAIFLIGQSRRAKGSRRTTMNDIVADALWDLFEKTEGKSRDQVRALLPSPQVSDRSPAKVTQMPKPARKR
jgi:hypothetical protein